MNRAFEKELSRALGGRAGHSRTENAAAPLPGGTCRKTTE